MILTSRQNLMKHAEEVAYSSKGHFKSADWTKISLRIFISVPIILSIILIVYSDWPKEINRFLNCVSMIFSFLALASPLVNNQDQACKRVIDHMSLGNKYLDIYKQIRDLSTETTITNAQVAVISRKIRDLDKQTNDLRIPTVARIWSWVVIRYQMDLTWIEK
jgi:hypothetical protein